MHNEHVLPMLDELMSDAGIGVQDLDIIGFGAGPGSFTGIRIAASVCQGLALAADAGVVPIPSSLALARTWFDLHAADTDQIVTITQSKRDAWYAAGYTRRGWDVVRFIEDHLTQDSFAWELLEERHTNVIGDIPGWLAGAPEYVNHVDGVQMQIGSLLRCIDQSIAGGKVLDVELGLPVYLQADSPWQPQS
jgi:tRNA threonylcarbamoyladenosine biosynthesis protein TsaB